MALVMSGNCNGVDGFRPPFWLTGLILPCLALCLAGLPVSPLRAAATQEVPDWVVAGIAAVETGSDYRDGRLTRYRDRRDGAAGEVGPWQLSPSVLRDLKVYDQRDRVRTDAAFAERQVRAWLLRCWKRTGSWDKAVAAYHAGPGGSTRRGREYAARVRAVGMVAVGPLLAER